MAEPKPFASLSAGLLARKGFAKPAMRRQLFDGVESIAPNSHDDLGWNDMGDDALHRVLHAEPPVHRQIAELEREISERRMSQSIGLTPFGYEEKEDVGPARFNGVTQPDVEIAEPSEATAGTDCAMHHEEDLPLPSVAIARVKRDALDRAKSGKGKAAFTLRLDHERHFKLRLASAIERVSAQQLVTMALDQLLNSMPGLSTLSGESSDHRKSIEIGDR